MGQNPLDTFNLAELFGLAQKQQDEDNFTRERNRQIQTSVNAPYQGHRNDPIKEEARRLTTLRDAEREADFLDRDAQSQSANARIAELMKTRIGLQGAGAKEIAINEQNLAEQGRLGGQFSGGSSRYGGRGGREEQNPFLSQAQADMVLAKTDLARLQGEGVRDRNERAVFQDAFGPQAQTQQPVNPSGFTNQEIAQSKLQNEQQFDVLARQGDPVIVDKPKTATQIKSEEAVRKIESEYGEKVAVILEDIDTMTTDERGTARPLTDTEKDFLEERVQIMEKRKEPTWKINRQLKKAIKNMGVVSLGERYKAERLKGEEVDRNPYNLSGGIHRYR